MKATRSLGPELSVPLYRISLHCVGLHCMCGLGDIEGYLMPEAASPVSESDSPHSDVETSQQCNIENLEEIYIVCHQVRCQSNETLN